MKSPAWQRDAESGRIMAPMLISELPMREHGPGAALDHLHFGKDNGNAWTFVLLARSQGWVVTEPENNGFGFYNVAVYSRGV